MKKYILMLAVAAASTLVACGNNEAPAVEEAVEVVEEVAVDSIAADTVAAAADSTVVAE